MKRRSWLAVFAVSLTGCVSASTTADVARVRELTRIETLRPLDDVDVDPAASEDARKLLERPLDADGAVRVAVLQNRELRARLRELGVARGRVVQAGLLPNPLVEVELIPERDSRLQLRVEYDLKSALLAPLRARAVAPELEAARYRTAAAVIELGYRVRAAFYRAQSASQRLGAARRVLDGFAASRDATQALHDAGNVPTLELASREAAYEKARILVAEFELIAANEREALAQLLGAFGEQANVTLGGELREAPPHAALPDAIETAALRSNLGLVQARHELEALARQAGVTRVDGLVPDVSVDGHALLVDGSDGAQSDARAWRFGAGVTVGLPVFNRNQGTTRALEAKFDAGLERYLGMAIELRSAARIARANLVSAHARARKYQEIVVPAQRRVSAETLLQYNAMQLGVFQLLAARREELLVALAEVETRREYWTARAALDALLAGVRVGDESGARPSSQLAGATSPEGH